MNYRLLAKLLGLLALLVAGALLCCELFAIVFEHFDPEIEHDFAMLKAAVISGIVGFGLYWAGRGCGKEILQKEAMAIVGLGWFLCSLLGAIPLMLCSPGLPPIEAFFEAASGFTTTGSTVIRDLTLFPDSILLWRATMQWMGGMGILVLFVALLSSLGVGSKSLFRHESSAQIGYGLDSRIRETAMRLWVIYVALTLSCIAGLMLIGMSAFDAITHAFAAVSTGGFSPHNMSVGHFDSWLVDAWLCLFMVLGGTNFVLMARAIRRDFTKVTSDEELRLYLGILLAATLCISWDLCVRQDMPFGQALRFASFQVVSIMTTTGFGTADFNAWPTLSIGILLVLMVIGGSSGSTSGGVKVLRVLIFGKAVGQQTRNAFRPHQVIPLRINGGPLDDGRKQAATFFLALTGAIVVIATLVITAFQPDLNFLSCFSAVLTTLFNVGPGLDAVGPTSNFAALGPHSLLFLSFLMILGRLELFAVLALFFPSLWRRY